MAAAPAGTDSPLTRHRAGRSAATRSAAAASRNDRDNTPNTGKPGTRAGRLPHVLRGLAYVYVGALGGLVNVE